MGTTYEVKFGTYVDDSKHIRWRADAYTNIGDPEDLLIATGYGQTIQEAALDLQRKMDEMGLKQ